MSSRSGLVTTPSWFPVFGSHVSMRPSSCLKCSEHMKKRHRQKMTSTMGTTLTAIGLSSDELEPAMAVSLRGAGQCGDLDAERPTVQKGNRGDVLAPRYSWVG